ncbi:alpha-glucan family phosphorylase [Hymenobacter busanensis]|uniref:Alpha-glucan family phosphorylase n=1 Tax=Hymenobacter busanensis TaxID=2607656 RepID=A0A7L4ZXJ0_9BACT|nr:alpha-glucan family phosphorylase [Hymenobacter busanensis]KAA9333096.1 alpha-glucan family phosphorylase [Hymenobacter busanensis]QHJ08229.1 alpha-glucan family phosphorylase [Hymenobacter busanensis]
MPFTVDAYQPAAEFSRRVAYFSMEFAIDQALKTYSGGLGFLAGSHMRSAYELKQNMIGIGILWTYGYYDQARQQDETLRVDYVQKHYSFLQDTGFVFDISIHSAPVKVRAYYLAPEVFGTAPMFFLTTDIPENDYLSRTISHHLYDADLAARVAQSILLGVGGGKLLDELNLTPEVYHLNEGHGLPLAFYLYQKHGKSVPAVQERLVFTTHTPELAGNEEHGMKLLEDMTFFAGLSGDEVRALGLVENERLNYTVAALRLARKANGVSAVHGRVANDMWKGYSGICPIIHITNAQNGTYWRDKALHAALEAGDVEALKARKRQLKQELFKEVANQTGNLFDPDALTIVWARRFAGYKRANLVLRHFDRFEQLFKHADRPVQMIWAGKPYPKDYAAIGMFNELIKSTRHLKNCAVLTGYELGLSALLKKGSDVWLNTPRFPREASGTSGMTAAMNGSVNLSIPDGWIPEFVRHGENGFLIPLANINEDERHKDDTEASGVLDVLEHELIPLYYDEPADYWNLVQTAMREVEPMFDSGRMAREYYELMYQQ